MTVSYTDDTGRYEEDVCNRLLGAVIEYPIAEMVESDVEDGDIGVIEIRMENGSSLDLIARWNKAEKYFDSVTIFPRPGE